MVGTKYSHSFNRLLIDRSLQGEIEMKSGVLKNKQSSLCEKTTLLKWLKGPKIGQQ